MCSDSLNGQIEKPIRFRVDRQLAKLAKWLRLLGYDTISERLTENRFLGTASRYDDRIWVTGSKLSVPMERIISISASRPIDQLGQVIEALRIPRQAIKPFTRCSECNCKLVPVDRGTVKGRVPDFVWQAHRQFRTCDSCQKIFWSGSHVDKQRQIIDRLFE